MRLSYLYLRSRLSGHAAACLAGVAALAWLWVRLTGNGPDAGDAKEAAMGLSLLVMPLAAAVVVGVSTRSPFGDTERTAARSLPALRLGHLALLLALGAASLALVATPWPVPRAEWQMARNVLGFSGLAFLAARAIGAGISWVFPLAYGALALMVGVPADGPARPWAWAMQPGGHRQGAMLACSLLLLGLLLVVATGARESPGEVE